MFNIFLVAIGGAIGAAMRYLIGLLPIKEPFEFPVKTFAVNILGCFFIGLIVALALKPNCQSQSLTLFLKTGICGGFTTFSSFALESVDLIKSGNTFIALIYIALSVILGICAVWFAEWIIQK